MRILVADDHPIFRGGVKRVLEDHGHIVVAECKNGREVVERIDAVDVDLVLLDLQMPVMDGVETIGHLDGRTPVIVLTVSEDDADVRRALDGGASGYVFKHSEPADLMHALESVIRGYQVFPSLSGSREASATYDPFGLSTRERQVLDRLVQGRTLKRIADDLGISQHTVRTYQERLLEKFNVRTRTELVFAAAQLAPA